MGGQLEHAALARAALRPLQAPHTGQPHTRGAGAPAALGFGTAPLGNLFERVEDQAADAAIATALDAGIRFFDTAPFYGYGLAERRLGAALARVPAASVAISTKVGRRIVDAPGFRPSEGYLVDGHRARFDYSRAAVLESFEESLLRLRRDRVDVLLLHDVGRATHGERHSAMLRQALEEALPAMQRLKEMHACRAIGIGVNEAAVCLEIMQAFDLDLILLAGRYTLLEQSSLEDAMAEALRRGVGILVGGAFNSGLLADARTPGRTYNYETVEPPILARAQRIYAICADHGVDVGAAALQFVRAHPAVIGVVVGMRSSEEVRCTLERLEVAIPGELWNALRAAGLLSAEAPTP